MGSKTDVELNDTINSSDDESSSSQSLSTCRRISLPEHILAYIEKRELLRDCEEVSCGNHLKNHVMNNYVIVKRILSNLSWQDKLLCKSVCRTWHSAVLALQKEQLYPADFVLDTHISHIKNGLRLKQSGVLYTEPLVIFSFVNDSGFEFTSRCMALVPLPCDPCCEKEHCLMDYFQSIVAVPKECLLTARVNYLSYRPLEQSKTSEHAIKQRMLKRAFPMITGVYVPVIPDVQFHTINIKINTDMPTNFYDVVSNWAQGRLIKGVLVYVTEKFILQSFIEECTYLNYFKEVQPDVPYALGGCIVEDSLEQSDINQLVASLCNPKMDYGDNFVSENMITIGMFTMPKNESFEQNDKYNFDMYSLVIESPDWSKAKIQKTINEFGKKVPRFEHSIALKFACVGRDLKHDIEEDYFRAEFPNTAIIGCFGNGELGLNHPARPQTEPPPMKKNRHTPPPLGLLYSYSTVFVYIGWGKMTQAQT